MATESFERAMRLFIVLNPVAGFINPRIVRSRIKNLCNKNGCEFTLLETTGEEDLMEIVSRAVRQGYDYFVAIGGDGTISGVASGLVNTGVPMVVIPAGTGNALANDIGIPHNFGEAFRLMTGPHSLMGLDAVRIRGHYYCLNVGIGLTSLIVHNMQREEKRRFGKAAYILSLFRVVFGFQPNSFSFVIDGMPLKVRAAEIFIACGGFFGVQIGFRNLNVVPDDGKVDVFIIKGRTLKDYLIVAVNVLLNQPRRAPQFLHVQAERSIKIETGKPLPLQADGEALGQTPVDIEVIPHAVKLVVPVKEGEPLIQRWQRLVQKYMPNFPPPSSS